MLLDSGRDKSHTEKRQEKTDNREMRRYKKIICALDCINRLSHLVFFVNFINTAGNHGK